MDKDILTIKCDCIAKLGCKELEILNQQDKDCEINGVYLGTKNIKKVIKFLEEMIN